MSAPIPPTTADTGATATANNGEANVKPRLRAYKACENCRLRKIKCSGEVPCKACTAADIGDTCFVRVKAKPNRAPAKVLGTRQDGSSPGMPSQSPTDPTLSGIVPSTATYPGMTATATPPLLPRQVEPELAPYRFRYDNISTSSASPQGVATASGAGRAGVSHGLDMLYSSGLAQSASPLTGGAGGSQGNFGTGSQGDSRNPLVGIERALSEWCTLNDVPAKPLLYQDDPRIALIPSSPLPVEPSLISFEDDLMCCLLSAEDLNNLQAVDSPRLLNLYSRYRSLPLTLTDDQTALIYASLCIARFTQLRGGVAAGLREPKTAKREDVTYYRMARQALTNWGRASITSMWALFGLTIWVQIHGSASEHAEVLTLWAWQIQALGLHRRATAQLYTAQDMTEQLLAAYSHGETLRAIMTDLKPAIPVAEIESDPNLRPKGIIGGLARASNHAVKYLRDYADPQVDVTTAGYLAVAEEAWSTDLDELRQQQETGSSQVILGWAQMRLHWLRLLLHFPRMRSSPGRANQAAMYVLRSAAHILNIHTDALVINRLDPSWPQLKRIMVSGQCLVLCAARGECHTSEAVDLFGKLIALLQAHTDYWPLAEHAIRGFRDAAVKLGISIPNQLNPAVDPLGTEPFPFDAGMMGADLFLDLDFGAGTFGSAWAGHAGQDLHPGQNA